MGKRYHQWDNPLATTYKEVALAVGPHGRSFTAFRRSTLEMWLVYIDSNFPERDYSLYDYRVEGSRAFSEEDESFFENGDVVLIKGELLSEEKAWQRTELQYDMIEFDYRTRECKWVDAPSCLRPGCLYFKD